MSYIKKVRLPPTRAMTSGTKMHSLFEKFFDKYETEEPKDWLNLFPIESLDKDEQEQCKYFVEQERFRYDDLVKKNRVDEFIPLAREIRIDSDALDLKGYIDRVDIKEKGKEVTLVEYKTGNVVNLSSIRSELSFYRLLWDEKYGDKGKTTQFLLINPRRGVYQYMKSYNKSLKAMENKIEKLRCAIENNDFPKMPFDKKCAVCGMCRYVEENNVGV